MTQEENRMKPMSAFVVAIVLAVACRQNGPSPSPSPSTANAAAGRVSITVDGRGYHPESLTLPAGRPATLVFTRTSDEGCGQQLVFPALNIRRDLPLGQPVEVTITPSAGALAFTCGMGMYRGSVIAR
jgi:plastocyanin domain-containing protein